MGERRHEGRRATYRTRGADRSPWLASKEVEQVESRSQKGRLRGECCLAAMGAGKEL